VLKKLISMHANQYTLTRVKTGLPGSHSLAWRWWHSSFIQRMVKPRLSRACSIHIHREVEQRRKSLITAVHYNDPFSNLVNWSMQSSLQNQIFKYMNWAGFERDVESSNWLFLKLT